MHTPEELTRIEEEVLYALADGMSSSEIAAERFISVETLKSHKQNLFRKLNARNVAHAVALAYHYGILKPRATSDAPTP